jgi:hypothetical protein
LILKKVINIKTIFIEKPTPPPKQKKKKEPPFNIPEWAKELKALKEKVIKF